MDTGILAGLSAEDMLPGYVVSFLVNLRETIFAPLFADSRLYYVYVLSSLAFAYVVYRRLRKAGSDEAKSFRSFLFPKRVWSHPSAWLDLRYYFFHHITGFFVATFIGSMAAGSVVAMIVGLDAVSATSQVRALTGWEGFGITLAFMITGLVVADFTAFYMHYLQHKIPVLWQFHKVHHSAEVMHPISNFREHPIDNFAYSLTIGITYGLLVALTAKWLGYVPDMIWLLGAPVFMFLFNFMGYNLRHSHVWLRWPGKWSMVFPSPAHHQVHHSCHPDHLDKNFGFILPFWDVLFGTYVMPEDNRDIRFGVTEKDRGAELNSCLRLYFLPFRDAWRVLRKRPAKPDPAALASDGALAGLPDQTPRRG